MKRTELKKLYESPEKFTEGVTVCGWIKSIRAGKKTTFISVSDGSCFQPVQIVAEGNKLPDLDAISKLNTGAAISVSGKVILTPNAGQPFEINADQITVEGISSPDYPLQKKAHSLEYLRTISHLRMRANTFQAVFKIRSAAAQAIHRFFHENGFVYAHTPIITSSDCEGAGEMFRVTAFDLDDVWQWLSGKYIPSDRLSERKDHILRDTRLNSG